MMARVTDSRPSLRALFETGRESLDLGLTIANGFEDHRREQAAHAQMHTELGARRNWLECEGPPTDEQSEWQPAYPLHAMRRVECDYSLPDSANGTVAKANMGSDLRVRRDDAIDADDLGVPLAVRGAIRQHIPHPLGRRSDGRDCQIFFHHGARLSRFFNYRRKLGSTVGIERLKFETARNCTKLG
jgi:hypothetical protein